MKERLLIALGAFLLSLVVTYLLEKKFIPYLMRIKMGQTILEIGPRWHKSKEGTPTMGGLFFIAAILVATLAFGIPAAMREGDPDLWKVLVTAVLFGAVGFVDDFVKFVKKRNKGLSAVQKLVFQFLIAAGFLFSMKDSVSTAIEFPFGVSLELGAFYWVVAIFYIAFLVNAVNLTDGIDGLASGVTFVIFLFFTALAAITLQSAEKTVFFSAVCGGMIGFLLFNFYPARIFMGDTGSLFLGGAVAGVVYWTRQPLIAVLCGLVFIWEAISVVLQVAGFKLTRRRLFKMAPFHHHLELCGWKETGIVAAAVSATAVLCALSYWIFYLR